MRALVVDDYQDNRMVCKIFLQRIGVEEVVTANDGEEAWSLIKQIPPDLILSDWQMPRLDGEGLYDRLMQDQEFSKIPFIMMSASVMMPEKINHRMVKPIQMEKLQELIEKCKSEKQPKVGNSSQ